MNKACFSSSKRETRHLAWPILGLIVTLSTGTITWETAPPSVDGPAVVAVPSFQQNTPSKIPAKKQSKDVSRWADAVLARPLFSQSRRPRADDPVAAVSAPEAMPRLTGVIVGPAGGFAIFASTAGSKPTVVRPGDRLGTAVIEAIATGQVNLRGPNGLFVLHPVFQGIAMQTSELEPETSAKPGYRPRQEGHYSAFWKTVAANRPVSSQ